MHRKLLIFGYGYSAEHIAWRLRGDCVSITGTTRDANKFPKMEEQGVKGVVFDGLNFSEELLAQLKETTHLVITMAPGEQDPFLALLSGSLNDLCPALEWAGYLSTVGVYGNHDGNWVDETTIAAPTSKRSIERLAAEKAWETVTREIKVSLGIFRLSGIYGPGRNAFVNIEKGTARRLIKKGQVFNRIHIDDIAQAVEKALLSNASGIYNITDDEPAPAQDVVVYAHELAGIEPPPEMDFETAELSAMARSFYAENKRVSNKKSKQELGMIYQWPDYRSSLKHMWNEDTWR